MWHWSPMRSNGWRGWGMTALVIFGFIAAAALAVSSMIDTVRRYGGLALDLDGALDRDNQCPVATGPQTARSPLDQEPWPRRHAEARAGTRAAGSGLGKAQCWKHSARPVPWQVGRIMMPGRR